MQDPYEILGVSRSAADEEITSAYKKLARKYHPDLNPGNKEAERKMQEINGAYETIKDIRSGKRPDTSYYGSAGQGYGQNSGPYQNPFGNGYGPFNPFGNYGQANGTYGDPSQNETNSGSYGPFVWTSWSPGSSASGGNRRPRRFSFLRVIAIFFLIRLVLLLLSSLFSGFGRSNRYYYNDPYYGYGYYYTNPYSGYGSGNGGVNGSGGSQPRGGQ